MALRLPIVGPCVPADCGCLAPPHASGGRGCWLALGTGGGGPHEAGELSRNGDVDDVRWLLVRPQAAVDAVQAMLRAPAICRM